MVVVGVLASHRVWLVKYSAEDYLAIFDLHA